MASVLRAIVVGWLVLIAAPASAHYVKLDGEVVEPGTLTIGIALSGRPFSYVEDGTLRGFEPALAARVAAAHHVRLNIVRLPRGGLLAALRAGEVDAINTLPLSGAVPAGVNEVPYLVVGDHAMVLRGNPFGIARGPDLAGRTVSVTAGTTAEAYARALSQQIERAGHAPMTIHSFPDQRHTHFPVSMGHAAAYFVATVSAVATSQDPASRTRLVAALFQPVRRVGFAVRADTENIHHALEHAIAAMLAAGRYRALLDEYGLPPSLSAFAD